MSVPQEWSASPEPPMTLLAADIGNSHTVLGLLRAGEVRADCNPQLAAWIVYGSLEEILTGWVLGQLDSDEEDVERAVATVVDVAYAGLAA